MIDLLGPNPNFKTQRKTNLRPSAIRPWGLGAWGPTPWLMYRRGVVVSWWWITYELTRLAPPRHPTPGRAPTFRRTHTPTHTHALSLTIQSRVTLVTTSHTTHVCDPTIDTDRIPILHPLVLHIFTSVLQCSTRARRSAPCIHFGSSRMGCNSSLRRARRDLALLALRDLRSRSRTLRTCARC